MLPHLFFVAPPAKPGKIWLDQKCADAFPARRGIGLREDHVNARNVAIRDPGFCSVELVNISVAHRTRLNARRVGARRRLRQAKGAERFARGHAAQIFSFLRLVAEHHERRLHRRIRHANRRGHCRMHARHLFQHQHVRDRVQPRPAPLFRGQHAAAAHLAEFLDRFGGKFLLLFPVLDERAHLRLHELADGVADQSLVVVQREVH